jgi:hypothetical protein
MAQWTKPADAITWREMYFQNMQLLRLRAHETLSYYRKLPDAKDIATWPVCRAPARQPAEATFMLALDIAVSINVSRTTRVVAMHFGGASLKTSC